MKNVSCFLCHYHRCICKNICTNKKDCNLKEGQFYFDKTKIKNDKGNLSNDSRAKKIKIDGVIYDSIIQGCNENNIKYRKFKYLRMAKGNKFEMIKRLRKIEIEILE